jgi:hypothetical protein
LNSSRSVIMEWRKMHIKFVAAFLSIFLTLVSGFAQNRQAASSDREQPINSFYAYSPMGAQYKRQPQAYNTRFWNHTVPVWPQGATTKKSNRKTNLMIAAGLGLIAGGIYMAATAEEIRTVSPITDDPNNPYVWHQSATAKKKTWPGVVVALSGTAVSAIGIYLRK